MTTYFISRHPGAVEWVQQQAIQFDVHQAHLDLQQIQAGDTVIGSLPVNLAALVCQRQAKYIHMTLNLPEAWRGKELSVDQLQQFGAKLECYAIKKC